jgi:hypothetical protein
LRVKGSEGSGSGDAKGGDGDDAGRNWQIWKGIDGFATGETED